MSTQPHLFQPPQSTHHIQALARLGVQRRYRRGALLIQEGETGDTLYIVQQGRLRAFLADGNGKELTLGTYGPLEYVGEMSLDGGPRSANVEAAENSTCSVVTRTTLLAYIAAHPEFALELMARLIRRAPTRRAAAISGTVSSTAAEATTTCSGLVTPLPSCGKRRMPLLRR